MATAKKKRRKKRQPYKASPITRLTPEQWASWVAWMEDSRSLGLPTKPEWAPF